MKWNQPGKEILNKGSDHLLEQGGGRLETRPKLKRKVYGPISSRIGWSDHWENTSNNLSILEIIFKVKIKRQN